MLSIDMIQNNELTSPHSFKTTSIKVVSVPRQANDTAGLPAATLIIDEDTGITRAIINARSLTAVRTACVLACLPP